MKISNFLSTNAPKGPNKNPLDASKWRPSDAEKAFFNRKLEMAFNPWKVLDYIKKGTVTTDQIQTLQALYPKVLATIQKEVAKQIGDMNTKGIPIRYSTKIMASKILTFPIDRSIQNVNMLQSNYQIPNQTSQPQKMRTSKLKAPNIMSEQDRLAGRKNS